MSSKPKATPVSMQTHCSTQTAPAAFLEGKSLAADVYPPLLDLMNLIVHSPSASHALARVTDYLCATCHCEGMRIETASESLSHPPLSASAPPDAFTSPCKVTTSPVDTSLSAAPLHKITLPLPQTESLGSVTFLFASDASVPPREMLESLAACLSMRLANETLRQRAARAEETATRRLREVAAQYDLGQTLAPVPNGQVLQMLVERTALLMEAQACSLLLLTPGDNRLRVAASHGLPPDVRAQTQLLGEGVAGRVAQSAQPLLIGKPFR